MVSKVSFVGIAEGCEWRDTCNCIAGFNEDICHI